MYRSITIAVLLLTFAAAPSYGDFLTTGTFEWNPLVGDQAQAEAAGVVTGLGTSSVTLALGAEVSGLLGPNVLTFDGASGTGQLPSDPFTIGSIQAFNGATSFLQIPEITSLILSVSGFLCDAELNCLQTAFGEALLSFVFTTNTDDPVASADSVCIAVVGGQEQCAWQMEFTSQSYDIVAQFGSLQVFDLVPTTPGAFVTLGRDPTQNVIRRVPVPEPGSLALLAIGLAGMAAVRRRKVRAERDCHP